MFDMNQDLIFYNKGMISYNDIVPIESYVDIEDYIRQLNTFSPEIAGKMKYALDTAKTQEYSRGLVDGYDEGYEDGYEDAGGEPHR